MGRPDYIFGQFRETARCRDAQHEDGVCCAFAPQLVLNYSKFLLDLGTITQSVTMKIKKCAVIQLFVILLFVYKKCEQEDSR